MLDFQLLEEYLGSEEYYMEMQRYNNKIEKRITHNRTYMSSSDFKYDLIFIKQHVRKRGGVWTNRNHKLDSKIGHFNRVFDGLMFHARAHRWMKYNQSEEGLTAFIVYEGFKFEKLLRPDINNVYPKKITYLG